MFLQAPSEIYLGRGLLTYMTMIVRNLKCSSTLDCRNLMQMENINKNSAIYHVINYPTKYSIHTLSYITFFK